MSVRTLAAGGVRVKAHYGQQRDSLIPGESLLGSLLEIQVLGHTSNRDKGLVYQVQPAECPVKSRAHGRLQGKQHCGMWYSEGKQAWLRDMILQVAGSEQLRDRVKARDTQVVGSTDLKKLGTFLSLLGV